MSAAPRIQPETQRLTQRPSIGPLARRLSVCLGALLCMSASLLAQDAARVVGPDDTQYGCLKCHEHEVDAWEASHHFGSLDVLDESDRAQEILENLGLDSDGSEQALCQSCHVTMYREDADEEAWPEWGVSCESCHGAAGQWVDMHQDYGKDAEGKTIKAASRHLESAAHRTERMAAAAAAGMIHPSPVAALARNCLKCHSVPQERLVNVGGHTAGSERFDLLVWSQGEVRHGFLHGGENPPASAERRRQLYLVGAVIDLARSLESLATATEQGPFAVAMVARVGAARKKLEVAATALGEGPAASELRELLAVLGTALPAQGLGPGQGDALAPAARRAHAAGTTLSADLDLSALDALLPTEVRGVPTER